ncbi:DM13 domain-containing protein [uncultured Polaribacter sp.]|uniref:T9SS type A sorting domain-containing protein n=1 Tax=uncultured Polaribacter sp. TaxID=174711 RepID=UPI0026058D71|nr:DM13 domain-containing protein [uncultured Polaribacter sp.]
MKKILLFTFLSFCFYQINAQCTETASNFGNNSNIPSYNVSGDISVTLNTDDTVTINLGSNFSTASGPDVRVYLVNPEGRSIDQVKNTRIANLTNIEFGLTNARGAQSFTQAIPDDVSISDYGVVLFYCLEFNAFWDIGTYTAFTSSSCAVLNTENFILDTISFYPNPAKNNLTISNTENINGEIRIYNVLGKQVLQQSNISNQTIDISNLNSGIYMLTINADGRSKTQKLVIE